MPADESPLAERLIGYTEFRTDLTGDRYANVRTQRALLIRADGSKRKLVAAHLADDPNAWTQFADWSPDGKKLLMTSLVNGVSKPFLMDLDGRNKRDVSGGGASLIDTLRRPTAS